MSSLYHNDSPLFTSFAKANKDSWIKQASTDLTGKDFDKLMQGKSAEGIKMYPFYTDEVNQANNLDLFEIHHKAYTPKPWEFQEVIFLNDQLTILQANQFALQMLEQGAESIYFDCSSWSSDLNSSILLENILLDGVTICWGFLSNSALEKLYFPENMRGSIYLNAIENYYTQKVKTERGIEQLSALLKRNLPGVKKLGVNAWHFSNCGATVIQEVALTCNLVAEYIDQLTDQGHSAQQLFSNLEVTLGTRSAYLVDIARYRATRYLLHQLAKCYGLDLQEKISLRALSSTYNKSSYDIYANMLRNTSEAMAAVLGGCNQVAIKPHDLQNSSEDSFSRRIARNVSHILKHEAHMELVQNPVDGSYALDELSRQIAEKAWQYFLEIEQEGGFMAAFEKGKFQNDIGKNAAKLRQEVSEQRKIFVGSNRYADLSMKGSKSTAQFPPQTMNTDQVIENINLPAVIENIRFQVDKKVAEGKSRPKVGVLSIDEKANAATINVRGSFVQDFLHAIGINSEELSGTLLSMEHPLNMLKKFDAIVLVSDDTTYASLTAEKLFQITKHYSLPFLLAGLPEMIAKRRQEYGVFGFIYKGIHVPELAENFLKRIKFL
ncbi:methylmalonyl-CoA mutase [Catalinimonas alkaloidigena]|uniref:methylmalonyl-CoA mutase family protein n=1 Tax=Catalinimonas alkaloidigena TaxID=1075417 RepID=UPI0024057AE5|nr:methylmalonyl-CoA mutase family protein [Catalinimonas alkaloidigena]MDF9797596.1 methylmalonyl-CoA mutase [Catalinimonas alkaloidigena]